MKIVNFKELPPEEKINYTKKMMREIVEDAKIDIETEFSTSPNDWMSCFKSTVFQLDEWWKMNQKSAKEKDIPMQSKIKQLKIEAQQLSEKYRTRDKQPSNEEKEKLFDLLQDIKETLK